MCGFVSQNFKNRYIFLTYVSWLWKTGYGSWNDVIYISICYSSGALHLSCFVLYYLHDLIDWKICYSNAIMGSSMFNREGSFLSKRRSLVPICVVTISSGLDMTHAIFMQSVCDYLQETLRKSDPSGRRQEAQEPLPRSLAYHHM